MFDLSVFRKLLQTERFGRQITWFDAPDSTNSSLWQLVDSGIAVAGHLAITDDQRNGHGRAGRDWFSQPGKSLCCSLLLEVKLEPQYLGLVALAGGVAVARTLAGVNLSVSLKWPNDIIHQGRKLGGLLTESRIGHSPTRTILGLGLNVGQSEDDFPAPLAQIATSLDLLGGARIGREQLLAAILLELEIMARHRFQDVTSSWMEYCAHRDGKVTFHEGEQQLEGRFIGLTDQGQAMIDTGSGLRTVSAGDLLLNEDDEI